MNLRILSVAIAVVALGASCQSTKKTSATKKQSAKAAAAKADTASVNTNAFVALKPAITVREEVVQPVDSKAATSYQYYVIIGSFKQEGNARNYQNIIAADGFTTSTILNSDAGFYRISVGGYNEEQPAREQIAAIRADSPKYSDVWLLKVKK